MRVLPSFARPAPRKGILRNEYTYGATRKRSCKACFCKSNRGEVVKHIIEALHRAAADSAKAVTSDVQSHIRKAGWDEKVIKNTAVTYKDGQFSAKVSGKHSDAGFVHEFGDENHPPTAALRKYKDPSAEVHAALAGHLENHLKGLL